MNEILSICIPTYNRSHYLKDLLGSIAAEIENNRELIDKFKIYLFDNSSTDSTHEICHKYSQLYGNLIYYKNDRNIGGDNNIFKCCNAGLGKYRWVVGDDDLIAPGGLAEIIRILEREQPGLFINNDGKYKTKLKLPGKYTNYREFANATIRAKNPHLLIAHTLITANIILAECFDKNLAESMLPNTIYAHMYGIVSGQVKANLPVYVTKYRTICIREQRAELVEERTSVIADMPKYWMEYINWLKLVMNLPDLDTVAAISCTDNERTRYSQMIWTNTVTVARKILPRAAYCAIKRYKDSQRYKWIVKLN